MVDLSTSEKFEDWLKGQPKHVSVAIAARSAWRVLPLLAVPKSRWRGTERHLLLRLFRRATSALIAVANFRLDDHPLAAISTEFNMVSDYEYHIDYLRGPSSSGRAITSAARAAASAGSSAAARFAKYCINDAAEAAGYHAQSLKTRFSATQAGAEMSVDTVDAGRRDVASLANQHISLQELLQRPLWQEGIPSAALGWPHRLRDTLDSARDDFAIWADWYDAVFKGGPRYHDAAFARAINDLDLWQREPAEINAQIKEWLEEERIRSIAQPDPDVSIATELDQLPSPPRQIGNTHVGVGPDGRLGYVVADRQGNNRQLLDQVLGDARALARDASQVVPDNEYKSLSLRAHDYAREINRPVEDIRWARVVFLGIRLEQAREAAIRDISREGTPPLDDDAEEKVSSLLAVHHILVGATKDGVEIRQIQFEQAASVAEQWEFQKAAASVAQSLAAEPDAITPELRDDLLAEAEVAPTNEKAAAANRALVQNTVTGLSVAGTLGVISYASASYFGAGGLVAATGVNFLLLEGLKKGKRFQELCQTIGESSNHAFEKSRDIFERRILFRDKIVELEAPLTQLARVAKWPWLERYVDFAKSLKDTDKS